MPGLNERERLAEYYAFKTTVELPEDTEVAAGVVEGLRRLASRAWLSPIEENVVFLDAKDEPVPYGSANAKTVELSARAVEGVLYWVRQSVQGKYAVPEAEAILAVAQVALERIDEQRKPLADAWREEAVARAGGPRP